MTLEVKNISDMAFDRENGTIEEICPLCGWYVEPICCCSDSVKVEYHSEAWAFFINRGYRTREIDHDKGICRMQR